MKTCSKFETCAFTHASTEFKLLGTLDHYMSAYCHADDSSHCVRIQLEDKNGAIHVPSNMMPNGLPLPGTHRRDWTEVALEYKKHI